MGYSRDRDNSRGNSSRQSRFFTGYNYSSNLVLTVDLGELQLVTHNRNDVAPKVRLFQTI